MHLWRDNLDVARGGSDIAATFLLFAALSPLSETYELFADIAGEAVQFHDRSKVDWACASCRCRS